jgi:hypothetical protein
MTFARKEQLRSHVVRFHGANVSPAQEVWGAEQHAQSHMYGHRRKSLKLLSYANERNVVALNLSSTQSQSQPVDYILLQDSRNTWSQQLVMTSQVIGPANDDTSTYVQCNVSSQDTTQLPSQNMTLLSTSQVDKLFSNETPLQRV